VARQTRAPRLATRIVGPSSDGSFTGGTMTAGRLPAPDRVAGLAADGPRGAALANLPDRIAFLGFGLIGGSIALALREAGSAARLAAWTPYGNGPAEGLRRGFLDEAAPTAAAALKGAGLVVLAGPPLVVLGTLGDLAGPLRDALSPEATVTDVASTKAMITRNAAAAGLAFVGGHPMAGRETSGVDAATPDLFVNRPWVVVRTAGSRALDVERVEALAVGVGARPVEMDAQEHDAAVAGISHLPLVLAAALVESVATTREDGPSWPLARRLAATGWADMTRLARGDPGMGAGILATNAGPVAARLRALRLVLDTWIELLDRDQGEDSGALEGRFRLARESLEHEPGP
jgi:prephenate dehydrogenase